MSGVNLGVNAIIKNLSQEKRRLFLFFLQDTQENEYHAWLWVQLHFVHCRAVFSHMLLHFSQIGKRNFQVQSLQEKKSTEKKFVNRMHFLWLTLVSFNKVKEVLTGGENTPGLESKLNPPPWPPKKALKMLFASKSREKAKVNTAGLAGVDGLKEERGGTTDDVN